MPIDSQNQRDTFVISEENSLLIGYIINEIKKANNLNSVLHYRYSDFFSGFGNLNKVPHEKVILLKNETPSKPKWNILLGDFPIGVKSNNPKIDLNIEKTLESLEFIDDEGIGFYIYQGYQSIINRFELNTLLESKGFFINAIFNLPKNIWKPYTAIRPIIIVVSKKNNEKTFVAEIESFSDTERIIKNYLTNTNSDNLYSGIIVDLKKFKGFSVWFYEKQIKALDSDYTKFKQLQLRDITTEISIIRLNEELEEIENAIYVPAIGNKATVTKVLDLSLKPHNYYKIVVNPEIVNNEYLSNYLNSTLGSLLLDSFKIQSEIIPRMRISDLREMNVAIPEIDIQKEVVSTIKKLQIVKSKIDSFENNISLNPITSKSVLDQIDSIIEIVSELDDNDRIKSLIRTGECKTIEFKESFALCMREGTKKKELQLEVIKTIAAFLNSDGGNLLIGVNNDGKITGLENEIDKFHKSNDKFLLNFKDILKDKIGAQFYPLINQRLVIIESKLILLVSCLPSEKVVFVENEDFYVRTNPATDKLTGTRQFEYIQNRFKL